jgi:hypothetical protein
MIAKVRLSYTTVSYGSTEGIICVGGYDRGLYYVRVPDERVSHRRVSHRCFILREAVL